MRTLKEMDFKHVYRTGKDDLYNHFYKKALSVSVAYDRAVGFFSSEILAMSVKGLSQLVKSNGSMRLIIGHPLDQDEFNAVKHGINLRELIDDLSTRFEKMFTEPTQKHERLEVLAWLIACNKLEVKFAFRKAGMYHEKIGIFRDRDGDKLVFQGSANETPHGLVSTLNAESLSVYKSWEPNLYDAYGIEYELAFKRLWENDEENILTVDIPSATYEKISQHASDSGILFDNITDFEDEIEENNSRISTVLPSIPERIGAKPFKIFKHQKDALSRWKGNNFKGILKLATGSGKTITSIYGAVKVFEARQSEKHSFCLIVAVPYVELASQWIENLRLFNVYAHECFDNRDKWYQRLESQINCFNAGIAPFLACVVVNRTLSSSHFQKLINKLPSESLMFIGDECHNHGGKNINALLPNAYYKMGLSATPFRTDDDEVDSPFPDDAKKRLENYYGGIVDEYTLGTAILDDILTPYEYHIIPAYLTVAEQEFYEDLSSRISKLIVKKQTSSLSSIEKQTLTTLCGKRSRLLGSAKNKLIKLEEIIKNKKDEDKPHTLFYAGEGKPYNETESDDIRVIEQVAEVLNSNGWRVSKFTSDVSKTARKSLMDAFKDKTLDALVAMKVLDEGIDVPVCQTAYILASTKNPRQYVQRRGRILRRAKNKKLARIFDFVVLPINDTSHSKRLRLSEAERVNDFALLADNKTEIEQAIEEHGLSYVDN